jgi:hypothetical protein
MDPLADAAIHCLMEHQRQPGEDTFTELQRLYRRAPLSAQQRDALERFFHHVDTPPDWVDWDAVIRGQRQLAMQALPVSASFLVGGLIESYTAPGIARILTETGRLADTTSRRIFETGQMVFDCAVEGSLTPGRMGHRTLLKVRLMHAFVRFHALRHGITNPINQAEMAFTLGMFGVGVLNGLRRLGLFIPRETAQDYHHLWRTAGYFLGLDQHLLPATVEEAFRLQAKLTSHLQNPDGNSRQLAHAVIDALQAKPPFLLSRRALYALSRQLLGKKLADQLGFPASQRWHYALLATSPIVFASGLLQARSDRIRRGFQSAGLTFGSWALGLGLKGRPADFRLGDSTKP